jgi:hypothetical protein
MMQSDDVTVAEVIVPAIDLHAIQGELIGLLVVIEGFPQE